MHNWNLQVRPLLVPRLSNESMTTFTKNNWFYISGPMTGKPELNRGAFNEVAARIKALGGVVLHNPALVDSDLPYSEMMAISVLMVTRCTDMMMLPGWMDSKGAATENRVAASLGKNIHTYYDYMDGQPMPKRDKECTMKEVRCPECQALFCCSVKLATHLSEVH